MSEFDPALTSRNRESPMTTFTLPTHMTAMEADALRDFDKFVMDATEAQLCEALFGPAAQAAKRQAAKRQAAKRQAAKKRRARRGLKSIKDFFRAPILPYSPL
jgi:hypothetical protein